MIFIYMAFYQEAKPIIQKLDLKREDMSFGFEVYGKKEMEIKLVITGVGSIAAATAVGSSLGYYHAGKKDILVNIGSCAGTEKKGTIYLCNKLTDQVSGYTYYPDILCEHPFEEACLVTVRNVINNGAVDKSEEILLYDMEGTAVYQAGSYFVGPHQMYFLKVVSDEGQENEITPKQLQKIMEQTADSIVNFLLQLKEYHNDLLEFHNTDQISLDICEEKNDTFERLCNDLCCSQTMKNKLKQCTKYWTLSGFDYEKMIDEMRMEGILPCRDRRDGKKRLEELLSKSFTD